MNPSAVLLGLLSAWVPVQDPAPERETVRETFPDGSRRSEGEAVRAADGSLVLDGKYASYHPDGSRESVGRYRAGQRSGSWRFLYPGGDPKRAEGNYKDGWRDGAWKAWTPDGKYDESEAGTYRVLRSQHADGSPLAVGDTLDGVPHGRWQLTWASGVPLASGELHRGRLQGVWWFRHADGALDPEWISGVYENGARVRPLSLDELPASPAADPGRLPPLAPASDLPVGVVESARAALQRLRAELETADKLTDERGADLALLQGLGRAIDDLALAELVDMDLADPLGARQARRWENAVLRALTGGAIFGLRDGISPEIQARNRLCVLRWRSLFGLARLDPYFLEFAAGRSDLPLGDAAAEELAPPTPLLPIPGLDGDAARAAMHPLVARRLPGLRPSEPAWGKDGVKALDLALQWLCDHQAPDGRWASAEFSERNGLGRSCACDGPGDGYHDVGVTGLALLALMGDGNSPRHGRHSAAVRRGVAWLLDQQAADTGLIGGTRAHGFVYDHAIATQALCEAAALCDGLGLRRAAEQAVGVCLRARNPYSAWRYELAPDGKNDTSITAWMVGALKAGQDAGLEIDPAAFQGALNWFDNVTDATSGRCGYDSVGSLSARIPDVNEHFPAEKGEAMTAAALLSRLLLGQTPESNPLLGKHVGLLKRLLPYWSNDGSSDLYYWHYATQAMRRMGGAEWGVWSKALGSALLGAQRKDGDFAGSWDPIDAWSFAGGRIYSTALMALCLEAPFKH